MEGGQHLWGLLDDDTSDGEFLSHSGNAWRKKFLIEDFSPGVFHIEKKS